MVFKFLQELPLRIRSFVFQAVYALFLFSLVSFFGFSKTAFITGFLFSQVYMLLFFISAALIFKQKKKKLGMILMFIKWLLLLFVLIFVSWFLEGKSFLIGLSGVLSFLLCYVFENLKTGSV